MMRSVLPRASARNVWVLTGRTHLAPSSGGRAPPLEEEEEEGCDDECVDDGEAGDVDASLHEGATG